MKCSEMRSPQPSSVVLVCGMPLGSHRARWRPFLGVKGGQGTDEPRFWSRIGLDPSNKGGHRPKLRNLVASFASKLATSPQSRLYPVTRLLTKLGAPRDPNRKSRLQYLLRKVSKPLTHQQQFRLLLHKFLTQRRKSEHGTHVHFLPALRQAATEAGLAAALANKMSVARDVVVCRGTDGRLHCTNFHVCFKPFRGFYRWLMGSMRCGHPQSTDDVLVGSPTSSDDAVSEPSTIAAHGVKGGRHAKAFRPSSGEHVEVVVNGVTVPDMEMRRQSGGVCVFALTGTVKPPDSGVAAMGLHQGPNTVQFIFKSAYGDISTKCYVHLWDADDYLVVSDIDGTITKSDVIGYIDTQLGKYDYTHEGICRLYSHLQADHRLRFVYLTSRPISMLNNTRAYLENCEQGGHRLPLGPIFTSTESLSTVLYKELIDKTIRYYKAHTLMDITTVFQRAGRDPNKAVFLFGFGNKEADGQAYSAAGLHPDNIFIIDPYSEIRVFGAAASGLGAGAGEDWLISPESSPKAGPPKEVDPVSSAPVPPSLSTASTVSTAYSTVASADELRDAVKAEGVKETVRETVKEVAPTLSFVSYSDYRLAQILQNRVQSRMEQLKHELKERTAVSAERTAVESEA